MKKCLSSKLNTLKSANRKEGLEPSSQEISIPSQPWSVVISEASNPLDCLRGQVNHIIVGIIFM